MPRRRHGSTALETDTDEGIQRAKRKSFTPTTFIRMRNDHGTVGAMEKLVLSGEIQSGFKKLKQLGLLAWSLEAMIMKYPNEFTRNARICAEWRLQQARRGLIDA